MTWSGVGVSAQTGPVVSPTRLTPSRALSAEPGYHVQASSLFIGDLDSMPGIHPFLLKAEEVILLHGNELDFDSQHYPNGPSPGAVSHPFAHLWCYHLLRRGSLYHGWNLHCQTVIRQR